MKYITITAKTYEEALRKAREQFSDKIRIHSRKDFTKPAFFGLIKTKRCELTFFVPETESVKDKEEEKLIQRFEQEAQTPAPQEHSEKAVTVNEVLNEESESNDCEALLEHASELLKFNDFSLEFIEKTVSELRKDLDNASPAIPSKNQFEVMILDKIAGLFDIDYADQANPPKFTVILGSTGVGKTTTIAKIAALYRSFAEDERQIKIVTLDSFKAGAFEQIESFSKILSSPVYHISEKEEFQQFINDCSESDLILVDTVGFSPEDSVMSYKLKELLSVCPEDQTGFYIAVNASTKSKDFENVIKLFGNYHVRAVIITKKDETQAVGNIISVCSERKLPILFVTDGQKISGNIHRASTSYIMNILNGFDADLSGF